VEVGEPDALVVQAVEGGRLDLGVAEAREVAVTLVVGQDEDDVGAFGERRGRFPEGRQGPGQGRR